MLSTNGASWGILNRARAHPNPHQRGRGNSPVGRDKGRQRDSNRRSLLGPIRSVSRPLGRFRNCCLPASRIVHEKYSSIPPASAAWRPTRPPAPRRPAGLPSVSPQGSPPPAPAGGRGRCGRRWGRSVAMRRTTCSAGEHGCQFVATLSRRSAMKVRVRVETGPSPGLVRAARLRRFRPFDDKLQFRRVSTRAVRWLVVTQNRLHIPLVESGRIRRGATVCVGALHYTDFASDPLFPRRPG
jgi:hypothetical protein